MGKTSQRRATQIQENNVGCTWGLIRMFYSRRDPKLILDRKQGSTRHSFSGFPGTASLKCTNHSYISYVKTKDRIVVVI
uniref:Uncharacterized protein n=1 Tax=Aegilops tauschii subsp. strangulata TaxID=200361 RepID=A0A453J940_AEGTS